MKKKDISAVLFALFLANGAHAEVFICKDVNGHTLTSDRPIPECADRTQRVLGRNGATKREIAPPMTAEQKKQIAEDEAKRKAALAAVEEQKRQDRALRARFRTEADIEVARKRDLDLIQDQIKREELVIVTKEKNLKDAQKETEFYKNKTLPSSLQRKIEDSELAIDASKKLIKEKQAEVSHINARYDQTLKRFQDLNPSDGASITASASAQAAKSPAK